MNQTKKSIRLLRDVEANMVPSGDKVTLTEGNLVQITQIIRREPYGYNQWKYGTDFFK